MKEDTFARQRGPTEGRTWNGLCLLVGIAVHHRLSARCIRLEQQTQRVHSDQRNVRGRRGSAGE